MNLVELLSAEIRKGENKMKKILCLLSMVVCFVLCSNTATASAEMVYPNLTFYIESVPSGFDKDVRIKVESENGVFSDEVLLSYNEYGYEGSVRVIGNNTYKISVEVIGGNESYSVLCTESLDVGENAITLNLSIGEADSTHGEESGEEIGNEEITVSDLSEKEIFLLYYNATKHMIDNEDYERVMKYANISKEFYLDENSEEEWDEMSLYDRFNYHFIVLKPRVMLTSESYKNENAFLKKMDSIKRVLSNYGIEEDDKIYVAIKNVWKWEYNYYMENGQFFDLRNVELTNDEIASSEELVIKIEDKITEEKPKEEISDSTSDENTDDETGTVVEEEKTEKELSPWGKVLNKIKSMWLTLTILAGVGIAVLVITLRNRKKNING